jgi:hypothetical protein
LGDLGLEFADGGRRIPVLLLAPEELATIPDGAIVEVAGVRMIFGFDILPLA